MSVKFASKAYWAVILALASLAGATRAEPLHEPTAAESLAIGKYLATQHCSACHAIGATGDSPNPAAPRFRELNKRLDMDRLGEGLTQGILTHQPAMPEFHFAPREVVGIVRYLKSVQTQP